MFIFAVLLFPSFSISFTLKVCACLLLLITGMPWLAFSFSENLSLARSLPSTAHFQMSRFLTFSGLSGAFESLPTCRNEDIYFKYHVLNAS